MENRTRIKIVTNNEKFVEYLKKIKPQDYGIHKSPEDFFTSSDIFFFADYDLNIENLEDFVCEIADTFAPSGLVLAETTVNNRLYVMYYIGTFAFGEVVSDPDIIQKFNETDINNIQEYIDIICLYDDTIMKEELAHVKKFV